MNKKINDTVETLFREQLQDWGKSHLNTGWAEKPAKGFLYSAMESAADITSRSCMMYRKIMIITAILCV